MTDRAVSTTVSYVLALGITTMLASGLIIAGGEFVTDQRERAIDTELQIVGEQLASDLERVDRIVQASPTRVDEASIDRTLPDAIAGEGYVVEVITGANATIRLQTESPDVAVTVPVQNGTAVNSAVVTGGNVRVYYDASDDKLEVDDV